MNEDNMNLMRKAVKGSMLNIKLKDGKLKMDSLTASGIMSIYDKANNKNKKSIEKMINTGTKSQIIKLQSLAMKSVKYGYKEEVELDEEYKQEVISVLKKTGINDRFSPANLPWPWQNVNKKDQKIVADALKKVKIK